MSTEERTSGHLVVVIGAGPAGIYGTRKLVEAGHEVVIINRDIKPGGLAEYGIYFNKYKMKEGIRKQFRPILAHERVHYLGHVRVGESGDLTLAEVQEILQPSAVVVASGAQGTKFLGTPGEDSPGVYHAKDLVYYYNGLPPFSEREFLIGDRVAILGIGNVMVDVAHYLVHEKRVKEVIAVARRGPTQRAYTDMEIKAISANIDGEALQHELERIRERIEIHGDHIEALYQELMKYKDAAPKEGPSPTRVLFRYLSQPTQIVIGPEGRPRALRVEDTELVPKRNDLAAKGLGTFFDIEVDTVIFAVGDRVDETLGLPFDGWEYPKNPNPDPHHPGDEAYQVYDPESGQVVKGLFVFGWSRKASDGLVGKAKQDAERGVLAVNHYLETVEPGSASRLEMNLTRLGGVLRSRQVRVVEYPEVQHLEQLELQEANRRGLEFFKLATDSEMLSAIEASRVVETVS